ncbi:MAG: Uma2 family endonuclease [Treponema sp.]|jgi:Uma2 family endonuclease|nr:Uma2 family endonuclease [Treponema sp.]
MSDLAYAEEKSTKFTYRDYKAWELKPGERYELIDGVAYAIPTPNDRHQAILMELVRQIANFLVDKPCKVRPAPYDVRLFYAEDESDDVVVQPDISVICKESKRGTEGCRGAPDIVVEILSPSNTAILMQRKLELYQDAGVREYWIVNPDNNVVTVYRLEGERYVVQSYRAADTIEAPALPGLEVALDRVFTA